MGFVAHDITSCHVSCMLQSQLVAWHAFDVMFKWRVSSIAQCAERRNHNWERERNNSKIIVKVDDLKYKSFMLEIFFRDLYLDINFPLLFLSLNPFSCHQLKYYFFVSRARKSFFLHENDFNLNLLQLFCFSVFFRRQKDEWIRKRKEEEEEILKQFYLKKCLFHVTVHSSFVQDSYAKFFPLLRFDSWSEQFKTLTGKGKENLFPAKMFSDDWWIKVRQRKLSYKNSSEVEASKRYTSKQTRSDW